MTESGSPRIDFNLYLIAGRAETQGRNLEFVVEEALRGSGVSWTILRPAVLFGGEVIHDFAFALLVGVLVGTYSSIFVASPIVALWEKLPAEGKA